MPRFILTFMALLALYYFFARQLIFSILLLFVEDEVRENAVRDILPGLMLLDELDRQLSRDALQTLLQQSNQLSNYPISLSVHPPPLALNADAPLLERIDLQDSLSYSGFFISQQGQVYQLGPDVSQPVVQHLSTLTRSVFFSGLAVIFFLWAWQWRRRIRHLNAVANQVAAGDLSVRVKEDTRWTLGSVNGTFNHMVQRLEALVTSQRFLVNTVAHELRTPLSRLRFLLEMPSPSRAKLEEELDELEALIDEVLRYSRFEHQQGANHVQPQNPLSILQQELHKAQCQAQVQSQESLLIMAPEGHLNTLFSNLISNGEKYAGGITEVHLYSEASHDVVAFLDEGPGFAPKALERALDPFYQGSSQSQGFGLGLAIVKQLMDQQGGEVCIHNRQPKGAVIHLRFKRHPVPTR